MAKRNKEMIITSDRHDTRVAVIENSKLAEIYIQPENEKSIVGNIYMGVVEAVLPGMEAAFIDIGLEKNAFLYVNEAILEEEAERPSVKIENIIKKGQDLVVQIIKEPIKGKGARVTTQIAIPGRYIVLTPYSKETLGISRKLNDDERERLKKIAEKIKPKNMGVIVRTAAEGVKEQSLRRDLKYLFNTWYSISRKIRKTKPVNLIHEEPSIELKAVRDWFDESFSEILVDDLRKYRQVKSYLKKSNSSMVGKAKFYNQMLPLPDKYNLDHQIRKALSRKVWLKSGGYIAIDHTEALTAIDVNTGRFVGKKSLRQTVLQTNLEATKEIVRQIRLRDIGGIIVIDFIDMYEEKDRDKVFNQFNQELEADRIKSRVIDISKIGLVEMTRKSTTESLLSKLSKSCVACIGSGLTVKDKTLAVYVERTVRKEVKTRPSKAFLFKINPKIAKFSSDIIRHIRKDTGKLIYFEEDPNIQPESAILVAEGNKQKIENELEFRR